MTFPVRPRPRQRRGSMYVLVLMVSILVLTIGLGGLALHRVKTRLTHLRQDWHDAGVLAQAAVDHAVLTISTDAWWRSVYEGNEGVYTSEIEFGHGVISWQVDDLVDDDLADNNADPLRIFGRGRIGSASRVYSVMAWPSGESLDVLRTPIHVSGDLEVEGALDIRLGPVSCDGSVDVEDGQILGHLEAAAVGEPDNVNGDVLVPAPPKQMPARALWKAYKSFATEIKYNELGGGTLQDKLISPAHHPTTDETNADGLYRIKAPLGSTLRIRRCRIEGTLLVELDESAELRIEEDVLWKPYRPDFPALIVYTKRDFGTDVDIECSGTLSEFASGVNFNPPDTPYYGDSDGDNMDSYPASIRGVVHVIRDKASPKSLTTIDAPRKITGCLIIEGDARTRDGSRIAADLTLLSKPPLGYTTTPSRDNLLVNGDMESGLTGWIPTGGGNIHNDGDEHTGSDSTKVKDRLGPWSGIAQDVTSKVVSGDPHQTEVWLKMKDDPEDVKIVLLLNSTVEGNQRFEVIASGIGTSWTRVNVEHTPTWTGTLNSALWVVETASTDQDFKIDDALLAPTPDAPSPALVTPVPGTWQMEAAP